MGRPPLRWKSDLGSGREEEEEEEDVFEECVLLEKPSGQLDPCIWTSGWGLGRISAAAAVPQTDHCPAESLPWYGQILQTSPSQSLLPCPLIFQPFPVINLFKPFLLPSGLKWALPQEPSFPYALSSGGWFLFLYFSLNNTSSSGPGCGVGFLLDSHFPIGSPCSFEGHPICLLSHLPHCYKLPTSSSFSLIRQTRWVLFSWSPSPFNICFILDDIQFHTDESFTALGPQLVDVIISKHVSLSTQTSISRVKPCIVTSKMATSNIPFSNHHLLSKTQLKLSFDLIEIFQLLAFTF